MSLHYILLLIVKHQNCLCSRINIDNVLTCVLFDFHCFMNCVPFGVSIATAFLVIFHSSLHTSFLCFLLFVPVFFSQYFLYTLRKCPFMSDFALRLTRELFLIRCHLDGVCTCSCFEALYSFVISASKSPLFLSFEMFFIVDEF